MYLQERKNELVGLVQDEVNQNVVDDDWGSKTAKATSGLRSP